MAASCRVPFVELRCSSLGICTAVRPRVDSCGPTRILDQGHTIGVDQPLSGVSVVDAVAAWMVELWSEIAVSVAPERIFPDHPA